MNLRIDEIVEEDWYVDSNIVTSWEFNEFANCNNFQVWTSNGWQNIRKIVRHKTEKKYLSNKNKLWNC